MDVNLGDIARGRRIVASTAKEMALLKPHERPARRSRMMRMMKVFMRSLRMSRAS